MPPPKPGKILMSGGQVSALISPPLLSASCQAWPYEEVRLGRHWKRGPRLPQQVSVGKLLPAATLCPLGTCVFSFPLKPHPPPHTHTEAAGFLCILCIFIPQSVLAWQRRSMKERIGLPSHEPTLPHLFPCARSTLTQLA